MSVFERAILISNKTPRLWHIFSAEIQYSSQNGNKSYNCNIYYQYASRSLHVTNFKRTEVSEFLLFFHISVGTGTYIRRAEAQLPGKPK
jgi:hypothetical protein